MTEALPDEEPSVLISAKTLRTLLDAVYNGYHHAEYDAACEEAESALERYK